MILKKLFLLSAAMLVIFNTSVAQTTVVKDSEKFAKLSDSVATYMKPLAAIVVKVKVDSAIINGNNIDIHFSKLMTDYSFRDNTIADLYSITKELLPQEYQGMKVSLYANNYSVEQLASKFYSSSNTPDKKSKKKRNKGGEPVLVENTSKPYKVTEGLQGKHLAVWQSHGWYYEQSLQRWEWQRARIFQTVEDLYTQGYVVPFLVPMLENAGANVLLPRERDINKNEVIVDNDALFGGYAERSGANQWQMGEVGFANPKASYEHGENPFTMGTYREVAGVVKGRKQAAESYAQWIPSVPESGEYAVYVSYKTLPNSTPAALYTVKYNGGETQFKVNQQMGGGTWIYLGTFPFSENSKEQGVYLTNLSEKSGVVVTADGVKFGGGMGNIARKPTEQPSYNVEAITSGYPRFTEGARYWLQWAGFVDSVYSYTNLKNDYTDDYMSRGRWVNALSGGSKVNPNADGYKVPVDFAFAFHTDAGTFPDDSIVGTLAIYTRYSNGSDVFPNGKSRLTNRELTDIIQTEIVNDVRASYEPNWSRRGLWDRSYSESRTPNVPTMLLELLSHQNFADMKYGLDPTFRFTVSRAIYKGIVKYFSLENGGNYVIQPLPVKNFAAELNGNSAVKLSWSPVNDPAEPTATPTSYVVYTKVNDGGFDNGVVVTDSSAVLSISPNAVYSFKVCALNDGGISFPSEILSVGVSSSAPAEKLALIVNGFERVSGPAVFAQNDSTFAGFQNAYDGGVPYINDYLYIGAQHEFRRVVPWLDDDSPGYGASYANYEDKVVAGNTFNYPYTHGIALLKRGYSFVSASAGAVEAGKVSMKNYPVVDVIMGKQSKTKVGRGVFGVKYEVFPIALQNAITEYCKGGGKLILSGANIATDLWDAPNVTEEGKKFAQEVLKYRWMTNYGTSTGEVKSVANPYGFNGKFCFDTKMNDKVYAVERADAIMPVGEGAFTIFRYADNNISAGVAYKGDYSVVSLGFPIETLRTQCQIEALMDEILNFFEK